VIRSLSGGQRKRVNIAVELLAKPRVFFLDEPTSGLDPGLEKKMMTLLREMSQKGQTVLLVTHATDNITLCDQVCFMAQGRMVYFGPPRNIFSFFGVAGNNLADVYNRIDDPDPEKARQKAAYWENRYKQSADYQRYVVQRMQTLRQGWPQYTNKRRRPRVNSLRQFAILTQRYANLVFRDKMLMTMLVGIMPVIGVLLTLISTANWLTPKSQPAIIRQLTEQLDRTGKQSAAYAVVGDAQRLLFMMALAVVLLGLFAASYEIVKERPIYSRERMISLRVVPYLSSKLLVLGAFAFVQAALLLLVVALRVKIPAKGVFFGAPLEMYVTLVLSTFAAIALGLLISALMPNTDTVVYAALGLLFFQIIFAGVIFNLGGAEGNLSALTLTRWGMEGLGVSTNVEQLNDLSQVLVRPEPQETVVSMHVSRPDPDWTPVSVMTVTKMIPITIQPGVVRKISVPVPEVKSNEMVTTTKTITRAEIFKPPDQSIKQRKKFKAIDYTHSKEHLLKDWIILLGFFIVFAVVTLFVLKSQDVV